MALPGTEQLEISRGESMREKVYNQIKYRILTNQLRPGQQIVLDQLVKQMGVSHTPVREALGQLEADGLVTIERYKNVQVTMITPEDVREEYQMRIILEGWAAAEAARRISDQVLDRLEQELDATRVEINASRFDSFLEEDITLHDTIVSAIDNRLFFRVLQLISNQSTRIRSLVETTHPVEIMHKILDEHADILAALRVHHPALAQEHMTSHLQNAMQRTLSALEQSSARSHSSPPN